MSPVSVYHFIPEEETFETRLLNRLEACQEAWLATAFFTGGAFKALKPALLDALAAGAKVKFLLGRFDFVTEPKAVSDLLQLSKDHENQLAVYFDSDFGFHYKLALFKVKKKQIVIIGSSNLS